MSVTCDDFEQSKKRQLFLLAHRMHTNPLMQTHLYKHGISDFDFVPEIIEKAIIVLEKETRKRKV
jgi:SOS response regulatory protein OraA/RecX